jgi:hypothetical protein
MIEIQIEGAFKLVEAVIFQAIKNRKASSFHRARATELAYSEMLQVWCDIADIHPSYVQKKLLDQ